MNHTAPVNLVPGTAPAQTPASTTAVAPTVAVPPYPTASTMATFLPSGTGAYNSSLPEFTGVASPVGVDVRHVFVGAMLALVAM